MHLHKLFLAQRTHKQFQMEKETTRTIPTFKVMKKHSKANRKYHQIFIVHRDQINIQLKKTPCPTYCLHLTTSKGPVCPVYRQTLSDGKTGFEWAFQHYLFTHITSHLRTGFNIQRKSTTDTWWKKPKRQGLHSCYLWGMEEMMPQTYWCMCNIKMEAQQWLPSP